MTLAAGTRLGPYEILAPLGAGGMGEVYKAKDTRLSRDVAIKVLPRDVSADANRLHRFEKEARAASALNHPNIVTVYDIGQAATGSFIAMELVDGRTLRELVAEGPMPPRRLLSTAAQIADGLAKAHGAGIVHRDLKPENVMVTRDGFVKILDFGLAKLTNTEDSGHATKVPTVTAGTEPGVVMGTVGYMSPEQALGKPLDFRSDQFSFGAILYEMATGGRAFSGANVVDTLSAILHKEPEPIARANPAVPIPLRWTVERCLAKHPEERYASTRDLARELQQIRDHSSQVEVEAPLDGRPTYRRSWRWIAGALAVGAALGAAGTLLRIRPDDSHPVFRQLTFRRGVIWGAAFAPDGHILYAANYDGTRPRFYNLAPNATLPALLDIDADVLTSISRRGELAVLRGGLSFGGWWEGGTLARLPMSGGAPKDLVRDALFARWNADGSNLAVVRVADGHPVLEYPIGHRVPGGPYFNPQPAPKGRLLAVARSSGVGLDIGTTDPEGHYRALTTGWSGNWNLAGWRRDGKELWFSATRIQPPESGIFSVDMSGHVERKLSLPSDYILWDVATNGDLLVVRNEDVNRIGVSREGEARAQELSAIPNGSPVRISRDGRRVLIQDDRDELYVQGADGSAPVSMGPGDGGDISPDGNWVAAGKGDNSSLSLLPTGAGEAKDLRIEGYELDGNITYLADGRHLVTSGKEKGDGPYLFLLDLETKRVRKLTPKGYVGPPHVSPDGRRLAFPLRGSPLMVLTDGGPPTPVPGCEVGDSPVGWAADSRHLYVVRLGRMPSRVDVVDTQSGERKLLRELSVLDPAGAVSFGGVRVTPDGRTIVFAEGRRYSTLYLVTGVR